MKTQITLICLFGITACVSSNNTRSLQALDLKQGTFSASNSQRLIQQFSNYCLNNAHDAKNLIETARSDKWETASETTLKKQGLAKLKKQTLKVPGGGSPVEESQSILTKTFEGEVNILVISERFDKKQLTSTNCALYGKQDAFLKNCASLGELINRAPDQNTKYEKSKAHFITWNAAISGKQARIKCQQTSESQTLPYEGTQLSVSTNHITPIKSVSLKKSNQQRSDASGR